MRVGSLFSGIGGFDLGLERAGMRIEWQVENNDYCREVLKKHWPKVPCHYDIKQIDWRDIPRVDLICGGFPCQPFSLAGKRRGQEDDRYLWPEVVRCLDALRPTWFLGENVPGIINLALDQVCTDLEALGYTVWPVCIPACAVDAPHIRQRVWILGYSDRNRQSTVSVNGEVAGVRGDVAHAERGGCGTRGESGELATVCGRRQDNPSEAEKSSGDVADAEKLRLERRRDESESNRPGRSEIKPLGRSSTRDSGWIPEPNVGRVAHGIPSRVDRLRGLGNAVVPQVVEALGRMILEVA